MPGSVPRPRLVLCLGRSDRQQDVARRRILHGMVDRRNRPGGPQRHRQIAGTGASVLITIPVMPPLVTTVPVTFTRFSMNGINRSFWFL